MSDFLADTTQGQQPQPGSHRAPSAPPPFVPPPGVTPDGGAPTVADAVRSYAQRVRQGELGSLPAVLGIILLTVVFAIAEPSLFSVSGLSDVLQQSAAPITLAMGLVFVLLLGEIDLSAAVVGSTAAAFGVIWTVKHGTPWFVAIILAMLFGTVCGTALGWLRARLGIPSFVVTLAAYLSFQGVLDFIAGTSSGLDMGSNSVFFNLIGGRLSKVGGWIFLVLFVLGYALVKWFQRADRNRQKLPVEAASIYWLRVGSLTVFGAVFVYLCNANELSLAWQKREGLYLGGVPWAVPIIAVLGVILTFVLSKTRYGRHIYAVGGNTEAARRAGIPVRAVRTSVFAICSCMAAISGLFLGSQVGAVNATSSLGNTLLLGVAAAVIGGTSLAGGRGRVMDAVLGGIALTILIFGMSDLLKNNDNAQWEDIVTGAVLLIAAGVDATSRHAGRASG